tara:strand:+ start:880 stop:1380 length:501 start_codon:yes stop_codon:yes gene_type:complete
MGYQLIETIEVGAGGAASIEFTGIDQTGVDLQVVLSARSSGYSVALCQFNNDSGSNYSYRSLRGQGVSADSLSNTTTYGWVSYITNVGYTANTFGNAQLYLPNYTSSSAKSYSADGVNEDNATYAYQMLTAGSWTGTAAITSVKLILLSANYLQYTTASLYKITAD